MFHFLFGLTGGGGLMALVMFYREHKTQIATAKAHAIAIEKAVADAVSKVVKKVRGKA